MLRFFFGVLFVFVFVIFMGQVTRVFTHAANYGADMLWVASATIYLLPDILVLSIPMAFQIALVMTLTAMSGSGEIMALRSAGFSFSEIARPIFIIAVILCALMLWLTGWVSPQGRHRLENAMSDITTKITKVNIEPKTFINLGDWEIFADTVDKKNNTLGSVHLARKNDKTALSTKINAANGKIDIGPAGINLLLSSGQMQRIDSQLTRKIIIAEFDTYNVYIPLSQRTGGPRTLKEAERTTPQIIAAIKSGDLNPKELVDHKVEPGYRLALSLAVLIYFILSCPVAFVQDKKAGRAGAMIFSIVFIFAYLGLMIIGRVMLKSSPHDILAYGGPLLPVIIGLICGRILWKKKLSD